MINYDLVNEITVENYNPMVLFPETDNDLSIAKRDEIQAIDVEELNAERPDLGCLVGCVIKFIVCYSQGHPDNLFCEAEFNACKNGCQLTVE